MPKHIRSISARTNSPLAWAALPHRQKRDACLPPQIWSGYSPSWKGRPLLYRYVVLDLWGACRNFAGKRYGETLPINVTNLERYGTVGDFLPASINREDQNLYIVDGEPSRHPGWWTMSRKARIMGYKTVRFPICKSWQSELDPCLVRHHTSNDIPSPF